jgi:SRSO17 transposase
VFLAYASTKGAAFIDRALYLPREWARDEERRAEAGVPAEVRFASKIILAERMLTRAFAADVPARWVVADSFYGRSGPFRRWLEEHDRPYAVMIPRTNAIDYRGRRIRVEQLADQLPETDSSPWLCLALSEECAAGRGRWLLIRRDADDPSDDAYWLAYGPAETSNEELVRVCDTRWQVEECFAQAKGEVGVDQYEVRTWTAWHRFVTLCLLAHASLVVLRSVARQEETAEKGALIPT